MTHLLSLSAIHAANPKALDVLFGPDGDFEGAPNFAGPVRLPDGRYAPMAWLLCQPWSPATYPGAALDLRVPTVAARVAGLCARIVEGGRVIYPCGESPVTASEFLAAALRSPVAGGFDPSLAADLAALFLALAPRMAS